MCARRTVTSKAKINGADFFFHSAGTFRAAPIPFEKISKKIDFGLFEACKRYDFPKLNIFRILEHSIRYDYAFWNRRVPYCGENIAN